MNCQTFFKIQNYRKNTGKQNENCEKQPFSPGIVKLFITNEVRNNQFFNVFST